ncbi:hypothetical protein DXG01_006872 [Tephrocybe rancida]|nr:hypothetical protein DXG01_006872 [Tephrocybe rancida]
MIGLVVWRATSGKSENQISPSIQRALSDLKRCEIYYNYERCLDSDIIVSSVDGIRNAVEEKTQKNVGSKVFHVTVNQETIVKWRNELNRFMALFNTELNISANLKLDELLTSFQDFRATVTLNVQTDVQVPDELPARPQIFVGRDDLVRSTMESLLTYRDVALIGPGGMGKSSVARAVLNDETLTAKFQQRRFFVRFDDMDPAQITFGTFLDRIARALGFNTLANTHNLITKALSTSETLLILDNAETFLDAAVDAGRIADAIDGFGARPNVAILLTTRTTVLPPNLKWVRLRVPALEESPACDAFTMFYTPAIEHSSLIKLLSAVDFHPLSINLLAQAAVQNEWSPQDLIYAWARQRTVLLESGDGKIQSVAVTIETSLNSPSVLKLGASVRQLLQIIAFLPQGVSKQRLTAIFPGVQDIESCADVLCKHSLAYLNGDFITLLAPIRLYISKHHNTNISSNPLLNKVQLYYQAHSGEEEIVRQDDINIEHVLAHWVTDPIAMSSVLKLIRGFLYTLLDCRPRPVSLRPVINLLDPEKSITSVSCMDFFRAFPLNPQRVDALVEKGLCLFAISTLMRWIGQISETEGALAEARALLFEAGKLGRSRLLFIDWGVAMVYTEQGNYLEAEKLFKSGLKRIADKFRPNRDFKALSKFGLSLVDMLRGKSGTSKQFLQALPVIKKMGDPNVLMMCWYVAGLAELNDGNLDMAEKYVLEAQAVVVEEAIESFSTTLIGLAEITDRRGNYTESKALRARALALIQTMPDKTVAYASEGTSILAAYLAMEGNIERARELIIPAVANAAKNLSGCAVTATYLAGCIELIAEDFDKAAEYFRENIEDCISVSEFAFRVRSERALGEIGVVKKDLKAAKAHFEAASELCKFMGVPRDDMYREHACYLLGETFDGWKLYQEDHAMFRT